MVNPIPVQREKHEILSRSPDPGRSGTRSRSKIELHTLRTELSCARKNTQYASPVHCLVNDRKRDPARRDYVILGVLYNTMMNDKPSKPGRPTESYDVITSGRQLGMV